MPTGFLFFSWSASCVFYIIESFMAHLMLPFLRSRRTVGLFGVLLASLLCFGAPAFALAAPASFSASPLVLDGKGKPREILRYTVTLTNTKSHIVTVYPWVVNLDPVNGEEMQEPLGKADLATSLANWIEVSRAAVDLGPGESREVPVLVQINMSARPGVYHALVHFSEGPNRIEAESDRERTRSISVNMEVLDDANERLSLNTFMPDKNIFGGNNASFSYRLENTGNRGIVPEGKIRIFDRKGEEVAAIDANADGRKLEPSAKEMLAGVWAADGHFGKYKAVLDLQYGKGTIQDTVFFWVLPWKHLVGALGVLLVAVAVLALLLHSRAQSRPGYAYAYVREDDEGDDDVEVVDGPEDEEEIEDDDGPGIVERMQERGARAMLVFSRARSWITDRSRRKIENTLDVPAEPTQTPRARMQASTLVRPSRHVHAEGAVRLTRPGRPVSEAHVVNLRGSASPKRRS